VVAAVLKAQQPEVVEQAAEAAAVLEARQRLELLEPLILVAEAAAAAALPHQRAAQVAPVS